MRYYRDDVEGMLIAVGTGLGNTEITETEYNDIMNIIKKRPRDGEDFEYVLTSSFEWRSQPLAGEETL